MKARLITLFAALCVLTATAFAESAADIKHRLDERLPRVDSLKLMEIVGENNRGFLEERKPGAGTVVSDENRDRESVYALIAKETNATPDSVGRARAKQIAAKSPSGVWVQDESGAWKKK